MLNKDMTLCISLSARPSNNGTRFHNHLYEALGLNWIYKAFAPTDLRQAIEGVRGLGIRGCAISMPYKEDVIALVDRMDPSAQAIDSVNTIVNDDGVLTAHNTDYSAIAQLIAENDLDPASSVLLLGSGGMAKATAAAFRDAGFTDVTIVARNASAGRALAELYGFAWRAEAGDTTADVIVNVTPIGMAGVRRRTHSPSRVHGGRRWSRVRRRRPARRDPAHRRRSGRGQDGDHGRRGRDATGARAVRPLHRDPSVRRAGARRRGVHAGGSVRR